MDTAQDMLTLDQLRSLVQEGTIDTVLVVFTDLYGRFLGDLKVHRDAQRGESPAFSGHQNRGLWPIAMCRSHGRFLLVRPTLCSPIP